MSVPGVRGTKHLSTLRSLSERERGPIYCARLAIFYVGGGRSRAFFQRRPNLWSSVQVAQYSFLNLIRITCYCKFNHNSDSTLLQSLSLLGAVARTHEGRRKSRRAEDSKQAQTSRRSHDATWLCPKIMRIKEWAHFD